MSFWANQEINKLEKETRTWDDWNYPTQKIISLSKEGNVLHPLTAFVGVSNRINQPPPRKPTMDIESQEIKPNKYVLSGAAPERVKGSDILHQYVPKLFDKFFLFLIII